MTSISVALGELFDVGSSKRVLKSQWQSAGVPFYRGREVTKLAANGTVDNELFISESLFADFASKSGVPTADDIMVTAIGTIGNSFVVRDGDRFYFKDASVLWLKKRSEVNSEFINFWLKSDQFLSQLARGNGATVDTLTIQKMQSVVVYVPSLLEQHRIVTILDEAFEGIATAKAHAEQNLRNAKSLITTRLAQLFRPDGDMVRLADLAISISDGDHAPPPKASAGVPFITISNINKESRQIDFSETFLVSQAYFDELKTHRRPQPGDVLYTVTGSFGIPVLIEEDRAFCFQRHIGLVRPKPDVDGKWLSYALLSPMAFAQADAGATGTAQRTVSLNVLRNMQMPKLSIEEQRYQAKGLDALAAEVARLASIYQRKLTALTELQQSLLHQAFTGKL